LKENVIALCSASGGCGVSTLTVLLARRYAAQGKKALIVDLSPQRRSIDLLCGMSDVVVYDLYDELVHRCTVFKSVLTTEGAHPVHLIPAALCPPDQLHQASLTAFLGIASMYYDVVLLDVPGFDCPALRSAAEISAVMLLLCRPDHAAVSAVSRLSSFLREISPARLGTVFSPLDLQASSLHGLDDLDQALDRIAVPLMGVIPHDPALQRCASPLQLAGDAPCRAAADAVASRIRGHYRPLLFG